MSNSGAARYGNADPSWVLSKPYNKRAGSADSGTPGDQPGGGGATPTSALDSEGCRYLMPLDEEMRTRLEVLSKPYPKGSSFGGVDG